MYTSSYFVIAGSFFNVTEELILQNKQKKTTNSTSAIIL